jgi:succinate dehydrogenase / fumarate reductase cytochrome b subunit
MRLTGVGLGAFIVFHILHLTTGTIEPVPFDKHDVYRNVVEGFGVRWVAAGYLGAMALVGAHVWHGAWASLRSLGASRPSSQPKRRPVAWFLAVLLWGGFTSIPLAALLGVLR